MPLPLCIFEVNIVTEGLFLASSEIRSLLPELRNLTNIR